MPDWTSEIRRRLQDASFRPEREAEICSEIGQHLEDRYQSLLAGGQSPADAERRAWRELERRRELGIRMAIGATGTTVVRFVFRQALLVAGVGVCCGLPLARLSGRVVESRLFGVAPHDPLTYCAAVGAMIVVSLTAAAGPARAATRVDPIDVLRGE